MPVFVTDTTTLTQSTDILDWAEGAATHRGLIWPVAAADRETARRWVAELDESFGVAVRRIAYHHLLPVPATFMRVVATTCTPAERALLRVALPFVGPLVRRRYDVDASSSASSLTVVEATFDRVADVLASGTGFLVGQAISGADLTFAALASPLLLPPEHSVYDGSRLDLLPPAFGELVARLRAHAAGKWALELYAKHRSPVVAYAMG